MKRLIALIGAVATAFGLYADPVEYYANSFETTTEGLSQDGTTWSAATPWSTELTDAFKVEAYGQGEPGVYSDVAARRTTMFQAQDTNLNVLKLETGTNTLDLAIGDVTVDPGKFYFDQLVKFTGFEEEPTFAAGTKIAVWMSAIEQEGTPAVPGNGEPEFIDDPDKPLDEGGYEQKPNPDYFAGTPASDDYIAGETNLYVQVGTGTAARKVQIKGSFATETWYRITIKSLGNVIDPSTGSQQAGFLVFINGESAEIVDDNKEYYGVPGNLLPTAKDYYDKGLLFTAIDTTSVTLAKVGYQGIGAIDDVILTSTSPDFDTSDEIEIEIGSLALEGAKVIKIGDVTITDQTSIWVKPGDILVSYAANGPYIVRNGENVKWTFEDGKFVRVQEASTIEIIPAAAVLNKTDYKAADELYDLLVTTGLENGDNLEFLTAVFIKESEQGSSVYEFSEGTTIKVTIENNETTWRIKSVSEGDWVTDNAGAAAGFAKYYTLADESSCVALAGEVAGLIQADYLSVGDGGVTITGEGKVITLGGTLEIYDGENLITPKYDEATGYYTYALATEPTPPPTTGFAIIIAETENGTVETSVTNNIVAGTEVTITATPADNYELESITTNGTAITGNTFTMPAENVTVAATFKSTAQPGIIPGGEPVPVAGETEADALVAAEKLPITLTPAQVSAGLTAADFCNKVRPAAGGGFEAYVEVAAANAPVIETEKTDVKPIEVGATDFSATIKNAKPGLYYGFKAVDALGTAAEFAPVGSAATATAAGDLKITAPKGTGNARFYKLTVSITNIWAE